MTGPEYECRKCNVTFSAEDYESSMFCPNCGTILRPKYPPKPNKPEKGRGTGKGKEIKPICLTDEINVITLFEEFDRLTSFVCGEGILIPNTLVWVAERRKAYQKFRDKLSTGKLVSLEKLCKDFQDFLYFKNNFSWTTLYRTGLKAVEDPEKLWSLITFIQDESISIDERIKKSLLGEYHVEGLGPNILTGLLHTFYPDKYGVWNNRTRETLELLRRAPRNGHDLSTKYNAINKSLHQLCQELNTDLTTVDGFMWYVSKRIMPKIDSP